MKKKLLFITLFISSVAFSDDRFHTEDEGTKKLLEEVVEQLSCISNQLKSLNSLQKKLVDYQDQFNSVIQTFKTQECIQGEVPLNYLDLNP